MEPKELGDLDSSDEDLNSLDDTEEPKVDVPKEEKLNLRKCDQK